MQFFKKNRLLLSFALYATFLLFWRLDGTKLWRDEATTACWAREIVLSENHLPNVWNGKALVAQAADGHDFNQHLLPAMQGWLQFYVTALFFKLFGISTFTARLPFALLGLFGLWGFYRIGRTLFRHRLGLLVSGIASLSFYYIFYIRQCRYYALSLIFIIFILAEIIQYFHQRKYGEQLSFYIKLFGLGVLLYFSNYLTFATFWGAVCFALLFTGDKKFMLRFTALTLILGIVLTTEFYLFHWDFVQNAAISKAYPLDHYWRIFYKNLIKVNRVLPFYLIIPTGVLLYFKSFRRDRALLNTLILLASTIFISVIFTVILTKKSAFVRYYIQIIPAALLIFFIFLVKIRSQWNIRWALLFFIPVMAWHNLSIFTRLNESVVQRQFLKQDHENGPVIDFIQKNISPEETVAVYRNVKGMALYFYCPWLKWNAQLDSQNPANKKYRGKLPDTAFDNYQPIDWYILWDKRKFDMQKMAGYDLKWTFQYHRWKNWWSKKKKTRKMTYQIYRRK